MKTTKDLQLETLLEPVFIASNYMGDDGRPLAEMTATTQLKKGVEFELRRCPYSGSRYEKDMNASALPGLSQQIKDVISDTINLRAAYLKHVNKTSFDLESFWLFTRALDSMPVYLVRRKQSPAKKEQVPARVSAMFKAAQGLHLAPEVMLLDGASPESSISTDGLMKLIEGRGLFLDDDRACAGPPAMVEAFVSSATDGLGKKNKLDELEYFLGANGIENLFEYADAVSRIFASKALFEAHCRISIQHINTKLCNEQFQNESKKMLSRFGSMRNRSSEMINNVKKHFTALANPPVNDTPPFTISNPNRLQKMISLRNPHINEPTCKQATKLLLEYLHTTQLWMQAFTLGQQQAINALGYTETVPNFTDKDFSGLGYLPVEVLCNWLNISVTSTEHQLTVTAGASIEQFTITTS